MSQNYWVLKHYFQVKGRVSSVWASSHNMFIDYSVYNLSHVYSCLKTFVQCLFLIHLHWTHSQHNCNSQLNEVYPGRIFSARRVTAFLCLGTLDSTSALRLGATLNSKITNKQHNRNAKNVTLNTPWKKRLHYGMQNKMAEHCLFF